MVGMGYDKPMDKNIRDQISCSVCAFRLPRFHEIPDVGLYLEQTTKYVNQIIAPLGLGEVTGSMIRNYVKQDLLENPVKKQYSAAQIAHLIPISILKAVVPLTAVAALFARQQKVYTDEVAYNYFCEEMENILYHRFGFKETVEDIGTTSSVEKEMLRSAITAASHVVYLNACLRALKE